MKSMKAYVWCVVAFGLYIFPGLILPPRWVRDVVFGDFFPSGWLLLLLWPCTVLPGFGD